MLPPYIRAKYSITDREMEQEINRYSLSQMADYVGEDDNHLGIILGSKSGRWLRNVKRRQEAYEDTEVLWMTGEAKSALIYGGQGTGKTTLSTNIITQLITAKKRFGSDFEIYDMPHVILDASNEFTHSKFTQPQANPRILERMKPYYRYFPFIRPTSIIEKCVFYNPVPQRRILAEAGVYGDKYIGLKASDMVDIEFQQAFQLVLSLLNLEEKDPAARIVRRGCTVLQEENPNFFKVFRAMMKEEKREIKRRKSQSISRQGQVMLFNALYNGDLELGESPDIERDLTERKVAVFHFPTRSVGMKLNQIMFTTYLVRMLNLVSSGCPPFSLYGEEMHKPLTEEPNSVFSRRFREIYQLERKTGRLVFSVVRMPEYTKGLIDEADLCFTPHMRGESAKLLEGYVRIDAINVDIEELRVRHTESGERDANEWMMLENGIGVKKFFPIMPITNT